MEPLISVIVPIYKVEDYLPKCIESIINQSYKNLEIILVDDGSPDRCGDICEEYKLLDNRIKVIHKPNGGLSDARNAGIDIATGDYLGFVDSDDYIHQDMYRVLMDSIIEDKSDMAVCNYTSVREDEIVDTTSSYSNIEKVSIATDEDKIKYSFGQEYVIFTVAWNKLYSRKLFGKTRYPKGKIHEDEFTTYKFIYRAKKITYVDCELYYYLQRESSIMGQKFNEKTLHRLEAYMYRLDFYKNKKAYEYWINTMFFFKTALVQMSESILIGKEYSIDCIKPYKKYYNRQVVGNCRLILRDKGQIKSHYVFCLFPKFYMNRYINKKG